MTDNQNDGLFLFACDNLNVSSNTIDSNNNGIYAAQTINLTVQDNNITTNSGNGLYGLMYVRSCDIVGNNFSSNYDDGIY